MRKKIVKKKICYFCLNNVEDVDYRNVAVLKRFISSFMKIAPRRRSGLCAMHQRKAARAIKRAREMSLLPYLPE
ncbi:MAG: 30S ribosomal protein S18 [Candidatus Magasanikbacteria bacterium GW2011_GWC2_40_17]|uniref:Small ribosomal subunit protein bS18 n=1 Tax=Candidatus Magasanikbacteria bacterium GW2011_GWA2_42_32 TaxID=1619039 RepID=A0A0G1A5W3_9BACT|nr:MAG: 30S ribosomal protein S18 [Candidatus Magasanikbacteria bacterium GW2011_GWC2_40_17]KKS56395.1 MAG: 30S ribosomal protein S18 [Candidatus Magasanikbacteria bacterium GW2011_GWA2_42_32]OGH85114.1 MAG: 30S ribosomal protein S18 [Candidatus Magasanikbacteria bacterium RIFOXYB2_FULL_38_10]